MLNHVAMSRRFLRRLRGDLDGSNLFDQVPVVKVVRFEFDCLFFTLVIIYSIGLFHAIFLHLDVNTILHNLVSDHGGWGHIIDMVTGVALNLPNIRLKNANHSRKLAVNIFYYFFLPQNFIFVYDLLHGKVARLWILIQDMVDNILKHIKQRVDDEIDETYNMTCGVTSKSPS